MPKNVGILWDSVESDIQVLPEYDGSGKIVSGMFLGDVTPQNQMFLLVANKGDYKFSPLLGVGISEALNDNDLLYWETETARQLSLDGQKVKKIEFQEGSLIIEANY